jgi:two-component system NtrC family response regulator
MTGTPPNNNGNNASVGSGANKRNYDRTSYILVVDDDNTLLKFFKIHLNKFFSRVIVVKNAKEAIDTLREKEIDLVLSDIRMPRMDGLQLMKRVRKHDPAIPMLLISGALLEEDQVKTAEEEADGYLRKPFSVDDLHAFIDQGMQLREKYKKLSEFLQDKKVIRDILHGRAKVEKYIEDAANLKEASEILDGLKKAG